MKRIISALLPAALLICLAACGGVDMRPLEPVEPGPAETAAPVDETAELMLASESDAAAAARQAPASDTNAPPPEPAADTADYEAACACIGESVEALYAALGEPESSRYAASCEQENAEDGMLFYDGFSIWTLRTAEEETVRAVYLDD